LQVTQPHTDKPTPIMTQATQVKPDEVSRERNLTNIQMALFIAGVDLETAYQAAKVITSIKPGFIISKAEYQIIHQALGEIR